MDYMHVTIFYMHDLLHADIPLLLRYKTSFHNDNVRPSTRVACHSSLHKTPAVEERQETIPSAGSSHNPQ